MQKGFSAILIILGILIISGGLIGGKYYFSKVNDNKQKACTLEAKICPDGSSVGRTGPNCEFATCPSSSGAWETYTNQKMKFSFQYPQGYELKEVSTPNVELINLIKDGVSEITIEIKDSGGKTLDEILSADRGIVKTIFSKEIKLGDVRAIQERVEAQGMGGTDEGEAIHAVKENQLVNIFYSDEAKDNLEIILQSFKFLPTDQTNGECVRGGCSGQLCLEGKESGQIASTCEYKEEYGCYKNAKCEKQSDGKCSWTKTEELTKCLKEKSTINIYQ